MIKCKYFVYKEESRPTLGTVSISPMYQFNEWDQKDVQSIISIDTCCNHHGEVRSIVVYYNVVDKTE